MQPPNNMDLLKDIEEAKYENLERLFTLLPTTLFSPQYKVPNDKIKGCTNTFRKIEQLISSANHQWWDKFFLEHYISLAISPRGLRILKICPFLSTELATEWSQVSEFCTKKWMQLIIQQRDAKYSHIIQQLHHHINSLTHYTPHIPTRWLLTLKKHTKLDEDKLLKTKLGKIRRDLDDYNCKKVFNWKKTSRHPPAPPPTSHPHPPHPYYPHALGHARLYPPIFSPPNTAAPYTPHTRIAPHPRPYSNCASLPSPKEAEEPVPA